MLTALTQPNYPKAALGLEKDVITALALQKEGRGQFGIRQAAFVEVPSHLLVPSFLEKNISHPREFMVLLEEAVVGAGLLNQKNWSVSLPSNTARTAILTLESEPASRKESEEILDWKSEQTFGATAAEMRITRKKISSDREGKTRYFATAVKLSVIDEFESIFESLGWSAGLILPRPVSEANLLRVGDRTDSMLISSQSDGFTALLLRGDDPSVVRTVTCTPSERDDEIYRLLMFYKDRLADESKGTFLEKVLLIGRDLVPAKIKEISNEALGRALKILSPGDIGLNLPDAGMSFDDLAAPAGLASLAWN